MCLPPVTSSTVPVMYDDRSEARNSATLATSLGLAGPPHRHLGQLLVPDPLRHGLGHRRADQPGLDRVDPHPEVGDLLGRRLGHADDAGLGRRVVGLADHADLPGDRRHVDDRAALVLPHDRRGLAQPVPGALQVHGDHLVELLLGHLAHRRVAGDAGVVDHDVQPAEPVDGRTDERVDIVAGRHVAAHRHGDVVAAELLGGRFCVASRSTSPSTTRAPSSTKRCAIAKPDPWAPPVTTAVLPLNNAT